MFQIPYIRNSILRMPACCMVLIALSLGACSVFRPSPLNQEQSKMQEEVMGKGGYAPAKSFAIESGQDVWRHDGTELQVVMTAPTVSGNYPLIIYLPGLGEDAAAGRLWRETWAKAGYAVFSMQPVMIADALKSLGREQSSDFEDEERGHWQDDANLESSEHGGESWFGGKRLRPSRVARNSDLRYLGHEYFAVDNLKSRMDHLFWAFQQLKSRVGLRQPLFASVDLSRVMLAGYDLGAQTASGVLGEDFEMSLPASDDLRPVAAILLSPSVSLAEGNVRRRYQKLDLPILAISGSEDNDPYAISSPLARISIWEHVPAGGKYLLVLKAGRHRELAGSETGGHFGRNWQDDCDGITPVMGASDGRGGWMMGGSQSNGMMECFPVESGRNDPWLGEKHLAAIVSLSTAFMDATVKNDSFARSWLDDKAAHWLVKAGELKRR